jgi:molybdopterin-guanine dinucleotide biosynthesis protein A
VKVGVALLAGGKGTRLGGLNKALLRVGGETLLAREVAVLAPLFGWRVILAPSPSPYAGTGWPVQADLRAGSEGPLAGLEAALACAPDDLDALALVACDMPFLQAPLVASLRDAIDEATDAVVPVVNGMPQPLLAVYHRRVKAAVSAALDAGQLSLRRLLPSLRTRWVADTTLRSVDSRLLSFFNVNTPEAREEAERIAAETAPGLP